MRKLAKGLSLVRAHSRSLHAVDARRAGDTIDLEPQAAPNIAVPAEIPALDPANLPCIEPNPRVLASNRIVVEDASPASSAYKMLRTRVLQRMRRNHWKTMAVTGTRPGEGKSMTAINLSISLARDVGTSVVLVDLDLRKPSIYRQLGIRSRYGVGDFLQGTVVLSEIAVRPGIDRLGVVLNERPFPNSSEMLASPQAGNLVDQAKRGDSRIVVFDLPPLLANDDMLAFSPFVDALLLVVAQGETKRADITAARELLQDLNVVGAVLNKSSEDVAPYYY